MATFRKRGDNWRAEIFLNGVRESKSFPTKGKAKAWASQRETEIREGKRSNPGRLTIADLLLQYSRQVSPGKRGAKWEINRLRSWSKQEWAEQSLRGLHSGHIAEWRDSRLGDKVHGNPISPGTVIREMNLLSHVFQVAIDEWKLLNENPVRKVRRPKAPRSRERLFSDDEIERLCWAMGWADRPPERISERVACAMLLAIETGMRAGELCSLTPDAISLKKRVARLDKTKTDEPRDVPLSSEAVRLLKLVDCDLGLTSSQIDANFRKYRDRCEIEGLRFHDTRHTAITRLARVLDVLELARMVGHKNLRTLQIYYNETAEEIAKKLD